MLEIKSWPLVKTFDLETPLSKQQNLEIEKLFKNRKQLLQFHRQSRGAVLGRVDKTDDAIWV